MVEFDIVYGEGISKVGELIDIGVELGIVKKAGSWFSYEDHKLAQGREASKELLNGHPELFKKIEADIKAKIAQAMDKASKI